MKKIVVGVDQAAGLHPDNVMVTALCGVLRGAGTSIIKPLVTSLAGPSSEVMTSSNELTSPGLTTKLCWLAALTWVTILRCPPDLLPAPGLYNAWVIIFLAVRLETLLGLSCMLGGTTENNNEEKKRKEESVTEKELEEKKTE